MTNRYITEAYGKKVAAKNSFWSNKIAHNMEKASLFDREALDDLR